MAMTAKPRMQNPTVAQTTSSLATPSNSSLTATDEIAKYQQSELKKAKMLISYMQQTETV